MSQQFFRHEHCELFDQCFLFRTVHAVSDLVDQRVHHFDQPCLLLCAKIIVNQSARTKCLLTAQKCQRMFLLVTAENSDRTATIRRGKERSRYLLEVSGKCKMSKCQNCCHTELSRNVALGDSNKQKKKRNSAVIKRFGRKTHNHFPIFCLAVSSHSIGASRHVQETSAWD